MMARTGTSSQLVLSPPQHLHHLLSPDPNPHDWSRHLLHPHLPGCCQSWYGLSNLCLCSSTLVQSEVEEISFSFPTILWMEYLIITIRFYLHFLITCWSMVHTAFAPSWCLWSARQWYHSPNCCCSLFLSGPVWSPPWWGLGFFWALNYPIWWRDTHFVKLDLIYLHKVTPILHGFCFLLFPPFQCLLIH